MDPEDAFVRRADEVQFAVYGQEEVATTQVADGYFLPSLPLVAVYGAAYVPCAPLVGVVRRTVEAGGKVWGGLPDALVGAAGAWTSMTVGAWIHGAPMRQECQKFLCDRTDHVNMMYHTWCIDAGLPVVDDSVGFLVPVHMGIFDPHLVAPVHLDLQDAGVAFGCLEPRSVNIHDSCFSPENAMLALDDAAADAAAGDDIALFWSLAKTDSGRAAAFRHILPLTDAAERRLAAALDRTAPDLATAIAALPTVAGGARIHAELTALAATPT